MKPVECCEVGGEAGMLCRPWHLGSPPWLAPAAVPRLLRDKYHPPTEDRVSPLCDQYRGILRFSRLPNDSQIQLAPRGRTDGQLGEGGPREGHDILAPPPEYATRPEAPLNNYTFYSLSRS